MGEHARLGYSDKCWPMCPASAHRKSEYEDISGPAAIDGTGTHLLVELCLIEDVFADSYLGEVIGEDHEDMPGGWLVKQDRVDRANECLEYVSARRTYLSTMYYRVEVQAESRSNAGVHYGRDDWWGTSDIVIGAYDRADNLKFLEIADYKDGRGYVHEVDNSQLLGNLGGWLLGHMDTVESVRMTIVQPRTSRSVRFQDTNPLYVKHKLDELAAAAARTDEKIPVYVPDELMGKGHCKWCKHRDNCEALLRKQQEPLMSTDLGILPNLDFGNLGSVSSDELVKLARKEKDLKVAFGKITAELEKRYHEGTPVNGVSFKSVSSKRIWNVPDDEIRKMLRNRKVPKVDVDVITLASPTQILALECLTPVQKKAIEDKYISSVMGKEKFVVEPAPKASAKKKPSTLDMFGGVKTQQSFPNFK